MKRLNLKMYTSNIAAISYYLCSICKEMMEYDVYAVQKFVGHYATHGTRDLDDLTDFTIDDCEQFFLFFMDIKSAVNHWIVCPSQGHAKPRVERSRVAMRQLVK